MNKMLICLMFVPFLYQASHASSEPINSGYKTAGILFSIAGGACLITSVPFYIHAISIPDKMTIDKNINYTIGDCLSIGGLLLEGISIPLYIKHYRIRKKYKISLLLGKNFLNTIFSF